MKIEIKPVKNVQGWLISKCGRLFSIKTGILKEMCLQKKPTGYYKAEIKEKGKNRSMMIHRMVAEAWVDNPQKKPFVNHKDGNKLNNNYLNLEWVTSQENNLHSRRTLKNAVGSNCNLSKLKEEQVLKIRSDQRPQRIIALEYGVSQSQISNIKRRNHWHHI